MHHYGVIRQSDKEALDLTAGAADDVCTLGGLHFKSIYPVVQTHRRQPHSSRSCLVQNSSGDRAPRQKRPMQNTKTIDANGSTGTVSVTVNYFYKFTKYFQNYRRFIEHKCNGRI